MSGTFNLAGAIKDLHRSVLTLWYTLVDASGVARRAHQGSWPNIEDRDKA